MDRSAAKSSLWTPEQHDQHCPARQGGECHHESGCKPTSDAARQRESAPRFSGTPKAKTRPYGTAKHVYDDGSDICLDVRLSKTKREPDYGFAGIVSHRDYFGGYSESIPLGGAAHARSLAAMLLRAADTLERRGFE